MRIVFALFGTALIASFLYSCRHDTMSPDSITQGRYQVKPDSITQGRYQVKPDSITQGRYQVKVEYDSSYIITQGWPAELDTILGYTTISISVDSPGLITLTDTSIAHTRVSYQYSAHFQTNDMYQYGGNPDNPPMQPYQNNFLIHFSGDSIFAIWGSHTSPISHQWIYWRGKKVT